MGFRWFSRNGLEMNLSKTKSMIASPSTHLKNLKLLFMIDGCTIQFAKQYIYLGIVLDNKTKNKQ